MARIRTIKPEFWTDEKMALLDPQTRLVFLGLISMADDYGRLIDNVKSLDGMIFPHTDESCLESLETLQKLSRILRYTSKSGQNLIQIVNWTNHQKVNHPGKEILPPPTSEDWSQPITGQPPIPPPRKPRKKVSRESQEDRKKVSRTISTTLDLGPSDLGSSSPDGEVSPFAFMGRINAVHREYYGGDTPKGTATALAPLAATLGIDDLESRFRVYCQKTQAAFLNIPKFARTWKAYSAQPEAPRLIGVGGEPTPEELASIGIRLT